MNEALNDSFDDTKRAQTRSFSVFIHDPSTVKGQVPHMFPRTTVLATTSDEQEDDESVNILNDLEYGRDESTILLLKQIFPDESAENLWQLHLRRCSLVTTRQDTPVEAQVIPYISSKTSVQKDESGSQQRPRLCKTIGNDRIVLPTDFLRLPEKVAVRRCIDGKWQYIHVQHLAKHAISGHEHRYGNMISQSCTYCTKVVPRDAAGGLGMTLISNENRSNIRLPLIRVGALSSSDHACGPAFKADIRCNDILIGIDGVAFAESCLNTESLLRHAVTKIRSTPDPVVLHLIRETNVNTTNTNRSNKSSDCQILTPSLLDTSDVNTDDESSTAPVHGDVSLHSDLSCSQATLMIAVPSSNTVRRFIQVLAHANVVSLRNDEQVRISNILDDFDHRAKQWDELSAFLNPSNETIISLVNVRKALSVRIVNIFDDDVGTAYTIWVYDSESGKEWYAPVRYFRDFEDLRASVLPLYTSTIQRIHFPKPKGSTLDLFLRSPKRVESNIQRETKSRQLEQFLRVLCSIIYKEKLHPYIAEVAIHVQSFLGCDARDDTIRHKTTSLPKYVDFIKSSVESDSEMNKGEQELLQMGTRLRLKRALQCFTYRLFLLDELRQLVDRFVDRLRTSGPRLQDIEDLEAKGPNVLKARALADLRQIQSFLDKIQDMILEGCIDDFAEIAKKLEFIPIHALIFRNDNGSMYWDALVREAVREQVEVEIYVPLRSVVSRWLVNGWRHEDMEVYFRMNELRRRPPEFFRLKNDELNHNWSTVTKILSEGVGLSTLPCTKLRAIVEAAREIFRIIKPTDTKVDSNGVLGADDFLPIFIYCVVQAEMERPCALCVLLRTLCDPINQIGEMGYYLLTFEAAIKHCEEVDLTDHDREEMPSFQTIALDDA